MDNAQKTLTQAVEESQVSIAQAQKALNEYDALRQTPDFFAVDAWMEKAGVKELLQEHAQKALQEEGAYLTNTPPKTTKIHRSRMDFA